MPGRWLCRFWPVQRQPISGAVPDTKNGRTGNLRDRDGLACSGGLPPAVVIDGQALCDGLSGVLDEEQVVILLGAVAFAKEEAAGRWQVAVEDGLFQRIQIGKGQFNRIAVEIGVGAALGVVEVGHPAMQVGMLAPVVKLLLGEVFRLEIDGLFDAFSGCGIGIHIEAHFQSPFCYAARPFTRRQETKGNGVRRQPCPQHGLGFSQGWSGPGLAGIGGRTVPGAYECEPRWSCAEQERKEAEQGRRGVCWWRLPLGSVSFAAFHDRAHPYGTGFFLGNELKPRWLPLLIRHFRNALQRLFAGELARVFGWWFGMIGHCTAIPKLRRYFGAAVRTGLSSVDKATCEYEAF